MISRKYFFEINELKINYFPNLNEFIISHASEPMSIFLNIKEAMLLKEFINKALSQDEDNIPLSPGE